ncbi:membrane protein [Vibrio orientalis CIP 102891 = ATCC 33934]|uniref:Membrane protein n=1 Tax=Vibrio orientalis CIP 102891 = ATCC 33934 TaxID=675816 RepID=C9QI37_VIBOR|nr:sulfite exporter TauE/SafE family protein [Vibrio orientalis]EEX92354.1 membrane protein [Vibrio orientalis CIP 102891 = ATCC 33934]EGU51821.1 membrane protein [Vibrio orientalis CIP 102891 = ATCC 33934]
MSPDWIGAFLIGLIGAGHCMGMCGGIASMLTIGQSQPSKTIPLFYNFGRLASYAFIGAIVGGTVASISEISSINNALTWLRLAAAVFMVLLACYIGRWWQGLLAIEKLGQSLWRVISPAGKSLLPLKSPVHAIPFGFIWGWLPCGLVYSTLTWSAVSGSALNGALIMAAFGLGTLPAMLLMGFGATYLHKLQQSQIFRNLGALILLTYGLYTGYGAIILLSIS